MKAKHIIIGVVAIGIIILIANYQNIFKSVLPPAPVIVSSKADGTSSTIFEFSTRVTGEVRNQGGDGYVVIEAVVSQDGTDWTKTKQIYMPSYQTESFELIFDEVELFETGPTYSVRAYRLGN